MASKSKPAAVKEAEPDVDATLSAIFGSRAKISPSAPATTQESRLQKYSPSGDLTEPSSQAEASAKAATTTAPKVLVSQHSTAINQTPSTQSFLRWHQFEEAKLPPRENFKRSRREKIFAPLDRFKVELPGEVGVEGFGGVIEFAHNIFHSNIHLDFLESERDILLPKQPEGAEPLSEKELERIEVELFNAARYSGDSEYLTGVTWSEEGEAGSITLYKVEFDSRDNAVGVQPVAAMQDVPSQILVAMRTHEKIKKKIVFVPTDDDDDIPGAFKWKANPSRGPTYMTVADSDREKLPHHDRSHSRDRDRSRRRSRSRDRDAHRGPKLASADGIHATIPQFVALLHASRAILEDIESSHITTLETASGRVVPSVKMIKPPREYSHRGDNIHVAVFIPKEAEWAEEHIFWTDEDGMTEFRRKRYWGLIEREKHRSRSRHGGSRSRSRHDGERSHSRHESPDGERSGSRHGDKGHEEKSRRRRVVDKVHKLF
ncbi:hypothetical protein B0T16DRAFT_408036 [Cercophora newfieldiana]|uniref:Uncharacterized protein n=1 Tax=Cercophora newfieldiana TaxID=92897 RepID=A0AA39YC52_9PEZI|nr:hypothetical protein B0T16DRAFT_408036 [Cercophora newfieldiana]